MSDILGTIFGSKSKEKSSSSSNSNSVTGNNAYGTINNSLAPTLGFSNAGGDMIGALLGVPGYSGSGQSGVPQTQPTNVYPGTTAAGGGVGTGNIWDSYLHDNPDVLNDYNAHVNHNQFPTADDYGQWHYQHYGQNEGRAFPTAAPAPATDPSAAPTAAGGNSYVTPTAAGASDALNNFANSSGINFVRDQGTKAIEASQAGKGMLQSGATGKALTDYGQNLGNTYLNNYLTQLDNFSKLGTANAAVLSDAGRYSNSLFNSNSKGSGTGGKSGLLGSLLGNGSLGSIISSFSSPSQG